MLLKCCWLNYYFSLNITQNFNKNRFSFKGVLLKALFSFGKFKIFCVHNYGQTSLTRIWGCLRVAVGIKIFRKKAHRIERGIQRKTKRVDIEMYILPIFTLKLPQKFYFWDSRKTKMPNCIINLLVPTMFEAALEVLPLLINSCFLYF